MEVVGEQQWKEGSVVGVCFVNCSFEISKGTAWPEGSQNVELSGDLQVA